MAANAGLRRNARAACQTAGEIFEPQDFPSRARIFFEAGCGSEFAFGLPGCVAGRHALRAQFRRSRFDVELHFYSQVAVQLAAHQQVTDFFE